MDFKKGFQMPPANKAGGNSRNTDSDNYQSNGSGLLSDMMDATASRNNLSMRIDAKPYEDYGVSVNALDVSKLDQLRSKNQGVMEQFGNSLARTVGAELVGGTISGFGALLDVVTGKAFKADNDYSNFLTDIGDGIRNKVEEATPIYEQNPDGAMHFDDTGYIFSRLPSIMSSLTLLIPAKFAVSAVTKTASIIGKTAKAAAVAANTAKGINVAEHVARTVNAVGMAGKANEMNKFGQFIGYVDKAAQAGKYGKVGGKIASKAVALTEPAKLATIGKDALTAAFSRYGENYQESRQLYNQAKDETTSFLADMSDKEYKDWVGARHSELGDDIDYNNKEEVAAALSKKSADRVFSLNAANVIFDFIQIRALGKSLSSNVARAESSWAVKQAQKLATKTLGKTVAESADIATKTAVTGAKNWLQKRAYNSAKVVAAEWTEGIEEGINNIATQEGALYAKQLRGEISKEDTPDALDRAKQYLNDPTTWDAAIWGVIGGIGFQHIGKAYTKGYDRITKGKNYEPYAEYEKKRIEEIETRKTKFEKSSSDIDMIKNGYNPYSFETDKDGNPVFDAAGKVQYHAIKDDAEKEILIAEVKNKLISDITLNAIKVGNYDLLQSYMNDKDVRQRYLDAGLDQVTNFDNHTREATDIMNKTYERFVKYSSLLRRSNVSDAYLNIAVTNNIVNEQEAEILKNKIDRLANRNDVLAKDNPHITDARTNMQFDTRFKVSILQEFIQQMQQEVNDNKDNPLIVGINTKRINTAKALINDYTANESDLYKLIAEQRTHAISGNIDNLSEADLKKRDTDLQTKINEARTSYYELYADKLTTTPVPLTETGEVDLDKLDDYMNKLSAKLDKDGKFEHFDELEKADYLSSLNESIIKSKSLANTGIPEDYLHELPKEEAHVTSMTDFNDVANFAQETNQEYIENLMDIVENEIWHKGYTSNLITDQATARKKEQEFMSARKKDLERNKKELNKSIVGYYSEDNFEEIHDYIKNGNKGKLTTAETKDLDELKNLTKAFGIEDVLDKEYELAKQRGTSPVGKSTQTVTPAPASTEQNIEQPSSNDAELSTEQNAEPVVDEAPALTEEELLQQYAASAPITDESNTDRAGQFGKGFNNDTTTEVIDTESAETKQTVVAPKPDVKPVTKAKVKAKISTEETVDVKAKKELDKTIDSLLGSKRKYTLDDIIATKFVINGDLYLDDTIYPFVKFQARQNRYGVGTIEFSKDDGKTTRIDEDEFNKLIEEGKILPTGDGTEADVSESAIDEAFNRGKAIADIINNYAAATGRIKRNGRIDISIEDMMRYIREHYGENVFSLYKEIKSTAYFMQDMSKVIRIVDNNRIKNADVNILMDITSKSKEDIIKDAIDDVPAVNVQIDTITLPNSRTLSSQEEVDEYNAIMKLAPGTVVSTKVNDGAIEIYNGETKVGILPIVDIQPDGSYRKVNEHWNYAVYASEHNPNNYDCNFIHDISSVFDDGSKQSIELIKAFDLLRRAINSNESVDEMLNALEDNNIYKYWIKQYSTELTDKESRLKRANHILKLFGYNSNVDLSQSELYPAIQYSLDNWTNKLGSTYSYLNSIKNLVKQGTHDVVITNATSGRMIKLPVRNNQQVYLPITEAIYKDESDEFDLYYPSNEDDNTVLYKDGDPHTNHNVDGKSYKAGSIIMFTTDAAGNKLLVHTFPNSIAGSVPVGEGVAPLISYVDSQINTIANAWLSHDNDTVNSAFEGLKSFVGNKKLFYGLTLNAYPNGGRSLVFKDNNGETYTIFFNEINGRRNIKIQLDGKDIKNNNGNSVVFMDDKGDKPNPIPIGKSVTNLAKYTAAHFGKIRINFSMQGIINNKVPNSVITDNYGNNENGEFVVTIPAHKDGSNNVAEQKLTFPSYKDFLISNNLITTDTAPVVDHNGKIVGNFVASAENDNYSIGYNKNFSIGVKPKEEVKTIIKDGVMTTEQKNAISKELFEKGNSVSKIAHILGVTEYDSVLKMIDDLGVKLPEEVTTRTRKANESINKVVYADINTKTGQMRIYKDWYDLDNEQKVRKLIHEALHYYIHSLNTRADMATVKKEFSSVYEAYAKYVKSLDANSELAFNMKKYLNSGKNKSVQLEEFIVESLTSKELIRYLDSIKYDGAIENDIFKTEHRSLFTRLLDLMLSLVSNTNTDDVTLLTKVNNIFSTFNDEALTESIESNESDKSTGSNENTGTNSEESNTTNESTATNTEETASDNERVTVEPANEFASDITIDTEFDIGSIEDVLDSFDFLESSIKETPTNAVPSVKSITAKLNSRDRAGFNEMYENGQINIVCS